ncbi:precorrin-6Y C5,15-methyltransferase (decarboxylating) [Hathewaya proteolytica DSM 3090]|uniref:Precorrin-6Y C5,15-methyltransferase (Decarboxylating) n=1 Tax=Hathewaya proteolytica DSM 3090 TaxID=1121331 RepID=A0A1M6Q4E6_9CLOT|nr:precorrin-6y C5,15-methyltransferase (decarboxylating) subunit CbiE [Hathewaya proteolytica]SHK15134.1 precorrin-6Y C5,15-methyltransferase (decarboxylating) [Hathewaya proteolytica DSM 3090]
MEKSKIYIIGLGPGSEEYILPEAKKYLNSVEVLVGFKRAMDSINFVDNKKVVLNSILDLKELCQSGKYGSIGIIASGDPCYYGITNYVKNNICSDVNVIPGLSSFQYLSCKLALPWQNAYVGSMHGREENFIDMVRQYKESFWLVDDKYTPETLCKMLHENHIKGRAYVGENLSYEDEVITKATIEEVAKGQYSCLSVLVIERD